MNLNRWAPKGAAALSVVALLSGAALLPAVAEETTMERALCSDGCTFSVDQEAAKSGDKITVDVTGTPGAEVELRVFHRAELYTTLTPLGEAVPVTIGADGKADDVELTIADVASGTPGIEAYVFVSDWDPKKSEWNNEPGEFGLITDNSIAWNFSEPDHDGVIWFAAEAGGEFKTQFPYRQDDHVYLFEIKIDGKWETLSYEPQPQDGPVTFGVPESIEPGEYEMRSINTSTHTKSMEGLYQLKVTAPDKTSDDKESSEDKAPSEDKKPKLPKTGV